MPSPTAITPAADDDPEIPTRRGRAGALRAALVALVVVAGACSGDDGAAPAAPDDPPRSSPDTTPGAEPGPVEVFDGPDDAFYEVPDPLPPGEPGDLIRIQELGEADGTRRLRVMYHSRDDQGRDRAVTGIVNHPTGTPPEGGWPVVSWSHGTTGLAPPCAPSRWQLDAPAFGVDGVAVATDFVGLGPVDELHAYLSRAGEGNAAIDAVRAARNLPEAGAGTRWLSVGHSQGGHGALAAHELAATHAPELDLVGTVSFAPAAVFDETYGGIDDVVTRIVTFMGLHGLAAESDEIDLDDYVGPATAEASELVATGCADDVIAALAGVPADDFWVADPRDTEPAASVLRANDVALEAAEAPLLLVSGTADNLVVIERVDALFGRLCAIGQVTEYVVADGAGHDDVIARTGDQVEAWVADRFAGGTDVVDSCAEAGAGAGGR